MRNESFDPRLASLLRQEAKRQEGTLDLIPSENHASRAILEICATPLAGKYAEGYPGKRYYPGNAIVDSIEDLARERALAAFGISGDDWAVNVQAYSGSPANIAVFTALLSLGDTIMGMGLAAGGHLTHGHKVNFSGTAYSSVPYGVDEKTGTLNYAQIEKIALHALPKLIISGTTAYPRKVDFARFGRIAKKAGAYHMADISHIAGLVAAGEHPSPFAYADVVTMTTHKTLKGPRGAVIFSRKKKMRSATTLLCDAIDRAIFPGLQGGPHNQTTAAIAQMFYEVSRPSFKTYAKNIIKNTAAIARELQKNGATLVTGGTDTHLLVLDVRPYGMDGREAEKLLEDNNILANRNSLPGDTKPLRPSGVRMGAPAITARGLNEKECVQLARLIHSCLSQKTDIRKEVARLCAKHPLGYRWPHAK